MKIKIDYPNPVDDLQRILSYLKSRVSFVFVRFSDGETEVIRNRYSKITTNEVVYRSRKWKSIFPVYDQKEFNPASSTSLRRDLLLAAVYKDEFYLKGIPTSHNSALLDRNLYLRLNGGFDKQVTFADLLMNNNHDIFIRSIIDFFGNNLNLKIVIICNFRAIPIGFLSKAEVIAVGDNFFSSYESTKSEVVSKIKELDNKTIILSSASSLSNIIGCYISRNNLDLTFIDVGTALHEYLSLDNSSRGYSKSKRQKKMRW